jgi:hypothetical protein
MTNAFINILGNECVKEFIFGEGLVEVIKFSMSHVISFLLIEGDNIGCPICASDVVNSTNCLQFANFFNNGW